MNFEDFDMNYNFLKDNPKYNPTLIDVDYDPDKSSENLQLCHKMLWSKEENSCKMDLTADSDGGALVLINKYGSKEGEKIFSSDWIVNDYQHWKRDKGSGLEYLNTVDAGVLRDFNAIANTIGGRIIFPGRRINGKRTINEKRGTHNKIGDRFDITLECIRRFYNWDRKYSGI